MTPVTDRSFGILIAYLIPGFLTVQAMQQHSPTLRAWFGAAENAEPTVGGFLYVSVVSFAAGLLASTVRWLLLDTFHERTGIRKPAWDFSQFTRQY